MELQTKVFVINLVLLICTLVIDMNFLNDAIEENKILGPIGGAWIISTAISVPVWIIWAIWTI